MTIVYSISTRGKHAYIYFFRLLSMTNCYMFQPLRISDRELLVSVAVNKANAEKLRKDKKEEKTVNDKKKEDKDMSARNLWLAREGCTYGIF